jgi:hypothetical protein
MTLQRRYFGGSLDQVQQSGHIDDVDGSVPEYLVSDVNPPGAGVVDWSFG